MKIFCCVCWGKNSIDKTESSTDKRYVAGDYFVQQLQNKKPVNSIPTNKINLPTSSSTKRVSSMRAEFVEEQYGGKLGKTRTSMDTTIEIVSEDSGTDDEMLKAAAKKESINFDGNKNISNRG